LLGIAAILPPRSLTGLSVTRRPIQPVSAGDDLILELEIHNSSRLLVCCKLRIYYLSF
jgi:uncharacterized protein (DUF58 family)